MVRMSVSWVPAGGGTSSAQMRQGCSLLTSLVTISGGCILLLMQTASIASYSSGVWSGAEPEGLGYAAVVDAGSSGSRLHLFVWPPHSGSRSDLLSIQPLRDGAGRPRVHSITPGLSSLAETPERAGPYLRPLLQFAAEHVPADKHRETPVYVMATAGMRLLTAEQQSAIVTELRDYIRHQYRFLVADHNIQVITGREEGIYQWIAVNFALGRFRHAHSGPLTTVETVSDAPIRRLSTVGAIDMGGASMQIGFEVTTNQQLKALERRRHSMAVINLGCADHDKEHTYRVFVTSFLGYGANEVYRRHSERLRGRHSNSTRRLYDPCLVREFEDKPHVRNTTSCRRQPPVELMKAAPAGNCTLPVVGTGDWQQCEQLVRRQLAEERTTRQCRDTPDECPYTLQPPPVNLSDTELYGFSEFWYSMEDTLRSGGKYNYKRFSHTAKEYCGTQWATIERRRREGLYGTSDADRLARQCFKSVYLTVAVHQGLGLPLSYARLTSSPGVVGGRVCTWTLGALLYKLRFLPVRSVEAASFLHAPSGAGAGWWERPWDSQYVLFLCVGVVATVLAVYLWRLRQPRRRRLPPPPSSHHHHHLHMPPAQSAPCLLLLGNDSGLSGVSVR